MEIRKIQKSGNSMYVTLPRSYLWHLGIVLGDYVRIILRDGKIDITPVGEDVGGVIQCKEKKSRKSR